MDSNLGGPGKDINICLQILSQNVCYVAYPRSAQAYVDAMDSNLGEPGKDINICLKFCLKMFVMLHIPEALRHTVMPWTPTWVNQDKIFLLNFVSHFYYVAFQAYLKFCLKMFIMLHIPEALWHTVMPWTPTWVNEKRYSNARLNSIMLFLLQSV